MVRLAYWLVVMIMVGVTDRHSADEYDDTEPGNIESGDTRIRRALPAHASYVPTKQKPAIAKRHNATMNLMHRVYRFASGLYGFAWTTLRCNFTTYVGKALQWSIIRRL